MRLMEALKHAGRFSISPKYSLFHVTGRGEYTLLLGPTTEVSMIAAEFVAQSILSETIGLEIRCDGIRVDFERV